MSRSIRSPLRRLLAAIVPLTALALAAPEPADAGGLPYSLNSWMGDLSGQIGNRTVGTLFLPGTHDSGTSPLGSLSDPAPDLWANTDTHGISLMVNDVSKPGAAAGTNPTITEIYNDLTKVLTDNGGLRTAIVDIVNTVASGFSHAQPNNIQWQLDNGIRYLDLRVCDNAGDKTMYLCHGFLGERLDTVLAAIAAFVAKNDKEILVLDFNHLYAGDSLNGTAMTDTSALVKAITDAFGSELLTPADRDKPLNEIWAGKGQIFVLFPGGSAVNPAFLNNDAEGNSCSDADKPNDIWSPWPGADTYQGVIDGGNTNIATWTAWPSGCTGKPTFFVLQAQVTPDTADIAVASACGLLNEFQILPDWLIQAIATDIATYLQAPNPSNVTASACNLDQQDIGSLGTIAQQSNHYIVNQFVLTPEWQCRPNVMIVDWYTQPIDNQDYGMSDYGNYGPLVSARNPGVCPQ